MKNVEDFKFNLPASLLTFMYYFSKGEWFFGSVIFVFATLIPIKCYFLMGIVLGFAAENGYGARGKVSFLKVLAALVSLVMYGLLKYTMNYWLNIM